MPNSNNPVTITVFWKGGPNGYPDAANTTIRGKLNSTTQINWVCGDGVSAINAIDFTQNPQGAISTPTRRSDCNWQAVDTIKASDTLKYLIEATSSNGYGKKWSPDPELENEIEP